MKRKVKTILALLMALALVMSCVGTEGFSVFAETVASTEESSAPESTSGSQGQPLSETGDTQTPDGKTGSEPDGDRPADASGEGQLYSEDSKDKQPQPSANGTEESTTVSGNTVPGETGTSTEAESTEEVTTEESSTEESSAEETSEAATGESTEASTEAEEETYLEYIPEAQPEGITVTAYAAEGVFPEDVKMTATFLGTSEEEGAEVAEAAEALEESGVEYDGFLALDISFYNADGTEIEPEEGSVQVKIELAAEMLPEEADVDTLEVQHLEEKEDGVEVKTVADTADAAEGTVEVVEDAGAVTAEFSVEGFSTFTITWQSSHWESENAQLNVTYWDATNGCDLEGPDDPDGLDLSLNSGESFSFDSDSVPKIDGYTFDHAEYKQGWNRWEKITAVRATQEKGYWGSYYWTWEVQMTSDNWMSVNVPNIRLCYIENSEPDIPVPPASATVTTGKSAVLNDDGTYTLNLSVSGDRGSVSERQKVDVLFILDESNSMMDEWGENWSKSTRIASAKKAIGQIIGYEDANGLSDNTALDVRYAMVGFYGGENNWPFYSDSPWNDATTICNWTSDASELYEKTPGSLNDQRQYGGTNYEAGFRTGKDLLDTARRDALKVVIFISDGNPGYYYKNDGYTAGESNPTSYDPTALQHAVDQCKTLNTDYFYFVGVTNSVSGDVFEEIKDSVNIPESNKGSYSSNSTEELLTAFKDIAEKITFFETNNVSLIDPLSDYADLVPEDMDDTYEFTLRLEYRENVNAEYEPVATETVSVNANNGGSSEVTLKDSSESVSMKVFVDRDAITGKETIRVEFADDYRLAQNYRYTISTVITPSQLAKGKYAEKGTEAYNGTGENGTGTHSGQNGFWSNNNEEAKVVFTPITTTDGGHVTPGEPDEALFPKPVIQVSAGKLEIRKIIKGLVDDPNDDTDLYDQALSKMTFTVKHGDEAIEISGTQFQKDSEAGALSCVIDNLIPGETYTVTESGGEVEGYELTTAPNPSSASVKIEKDKIVTVLFTNTYSPSTQNITVKKLVDGELGDRQKDFSFTYSWGTEEGESETFKLRHEGTYTIKNVPIGATLTLRETNAAGYTTTATYGGTEQTVDGEEDQAQKSVTITTKARKTEIIVTNTKDAIPDTGIHMNSAPYVLMLALTMAGLAVTLIRRARRRRL